MTGSELDKSVKQELRGLPRSLADLVAQHLVASGMTIDSDPELAYQHAKTARRLAARLGGVREAVAVTAYLAGHYDEALVEFRAVRRMTGNNEVLPTMADCERALGRPEKALALSRERAVKDLELGSQMEMLIVAAGARRDMGQAAAALQTLEVPELNKRVRVEWLARLRYAYADTLAALDRDEEALVWFHRAAGVDIDGATDAAERAAALEGLEFTDLDEDDDDEDYEERGPAIIDVTDTATPAESAEDDADTDDKDEAADSDDDAADTAETDDEDDEDDADEDDDDVDSPAESAELDESAESVEVVESDEVDETDDSESDKADEDGADVVGTEDDEADEDESDEVDGDDKPGDLTDK
ncbi:hypothetical protein OG394_37035 [Kribbella sp. NBC_01245]|uniref:hypothetical protein n=1 Tax=Kribbella sp. NBC_01245 TaxID=2903578 RepID=UPI002E2A5E16|nr:hypothetical protein [Kribbella sp. NBC_01245]